MTTRTLWLSTQALLAMATKRPWEPLLVMLSIMLAAGGLTAVTLINEGALQGELAQADSLLSATDTIVPATDMAAVTQEDYAMLRRHGFISLVATATHPMTVRCATDDKTSALFVTGVDVMALPLHSGMSSAFQPNNNAAASADIARATPATIAKLNCPDNSITITDTGSTFRVSATSTVPKNRIVVDIAAFYRATVTPQTHPLTALLATTELDKSSRRRLEAHLPSYLRLKTTEQTNDVGSLSASFRLNLWAMGMLMAVVCAFVIVNALHLMYRARLANLIRLRQLGVGLSTLSLALMTEMLIYGVVASTSGVLGGAWLTRELTPTLAVTFSSLFNLNYNGLTPQLWSLLATSNLITVCGILLTIAAPLSRLRSQLQVKQPAYTSLSLPAKLAITFIIAFACLLAIYLTGSQTQALIAVVLLLLGGCGVVLLWLPPLLQSLRTLLPASLTLTQWSIASACQLSGRTRLAVCAFFIALTANTGMNVMVDSFRLATESWISQRLTASYYIYSGDTLDEANAPEGIQLFPGRQQDTTVNGSAVSARVYYPHSPFTEALQFDASADNAWQYFMSGKGAFINQQLAFRQSLHIGDTLVLDNSNLIAQPSLTVVGIYPDYGNPDSQLFLPPAAFSPQQFANVYAVVSATELSVLQHWLDKQAPDAQLYAREALIHGSMETFDNTFIVTDALNLATLLVAGLSFLLSVSLVVLDMRQSLSLIRSLGVKTVKLKFALACQYLLLCAGTVVLALPFGVLLAWVFVNQVNRFAFYWVYPLQINPEVLLGSALASMLVVSLFLLIPIGNVQARLDLRNEVAL
ncbi:FtsX-like permease family protein [Alteromonas sp. H39]|uniref:ABC transporter permease n=1 Tax=Alteromonas sp. H39 TaxID=3389876 RepID=UPI0039E094BF